jgi:membrane-associated phospholipid phosphatase
MRNKHQRIQTRIFAPMIFLASSIWQKLEEWDQALFIKLNGEWTNAAFDTVMPFFRSSTLWIPLYLFVLVFMLLNFKMKTAWWVVFFISTVALTDMTGTYVFKHNIERWRPCGDPEFSSFVRLMVDHCGGYGFTSNHAANHFGMATFFFITLRPYIGNIALLAFVWAALIAYAQVYVGLHYPLDVIGGALLGLLAGFVTGTVFNKRFGFAIFENQHVA